MLWTLTSVLLSATQLTHVGNSHKCIINPQPNKLAWKSPTTISLGYNTGDIYGKLPLDHNPTSLLFLQM